MSRRSDPFAPDALRRHDLSERLRTPASDLAALASAQRTGAINRAIAEIASPALPKSSVDTLLESLRNSPSYAAGLDSLGMAARLRDPRSGHGAPPGPAGARASQAVTAPASPPREQGLTPISSVAALGALIRDARKALGLNQQAFADLAGVGRRFVSELESGKTSLEFGRVLQCCAAAGIDLSAAHRRQA